MKTALDRRIPLCPRQHALGKLRLARSRIFAGSRLLFYPENQAVEQVQTLWGDCGGVRHANPVWLGAGIGAWAAGKDFTTSQVLACVCAGLAFSVGGLLLREERVKSARDLHREFEGRLALYDDDPKVQAIKARYKQKEQEAFERTLRGLAIRAFRKYLAYRRGKKAQQANPDNTRA
jgi:hypothetical protein